MLSICGVDSILNENLTVVPIFGEASSDLAAANLLYDTDMTLRFRSADAGIGVIRFDVNSPRFQLADCAYLCDHNLNSYSATGSNGDVIGTDSWRVIASNNTSADLYQIPTSVQELVNLTNVSGFSEYDVQHPDATSYEAVTVGALSRIRVRFKNPLPGDITNLPSLTDQKFWVYFRVRGTGSATVVARLKEGGVLRGTIYTSLSLTPGDYYVPITWSGTLLTGTVPDLELEANPGASAAVDFLACRWDAAVTASLPAFYDSGPLAITLPPRYRYQDLQTLNAVHFFPQRLTIRKLWLVMIRTGINALPAGAPEAGHFNCGLRYQVKMRRDSWRIRLVDPSIVIPMRGGNEKIHARRPYLESTLMTPPDTIDASMDMLSRIERKTGIRRGLFWIFDDARPDLWTNMAFLGRTPDLQEYGHSAPFFQHGFTVKQVR